MTIISMRRAGCWLMLCLIKISKTLKTILIATKWIFILVWLITTELPSFYFYHLPTFFSAQQHLFNISWKMLECTIKHTFCKFNECFTSSKPLLCKLHHITNMAESKKNIFCSWLGPPSLDKRNMIKALALNEIATSSLPVFPSKDQLY